MFILPLPLKLRSNNEEISEGVVAIFKSVIFKLQSQPGDSISDKMCKDFVIPSLLLLLDERDGAAKAASVLLADYCYRYVYSCFPFNAQSQK